MHCKRMLNWLNLVDCSTNEGNRNVCFSTCFDLRSFEIIGAEFIYNSNLLQTIMYVKKAGGRKVKGEWGKSVSRSLVPAHATCFSSARFS